MSTPAIVVEDLSFSYPGQVRPVLEHLSFTVAQGETLLILGPSGSGKSTLALCLNGLIPHAIPGEMRGRVLVEGRDTVATPTAELARTVGIVFQDPDSQFCMLRVDDEIAFGLENLNVPRSEMAARIQRALNLVGMTGASRTRIDHLSGGERQRVALAAVLALDPAILVLDEPTSNLDPAGAEDFFATIGRLRARRDRTIIIIEHRLDSVMHLTDRILVLGPGGRRIALGPPTEILSVYGRTLDELGIWIPQVSEVANRLRQAGIHPDPYPVTIAGAVEAFRRIVMETPGREGGAHNGDALPSLPDAVASNALVAMQPASPPAGRRMEAPVAVEITGLSYCYPGGARALQEVSLAVPTGAFVAIVGPNGAGKSTLAAHLIGSLPAPRGVVRLFGRDIRAIPSRELPRFVGYVFQNPEHQFVARTVYDELAFGLRVQGRTESEIGRIVQAVLTDFGLQDHAAANPFTLSHGEKRRLSVATMLVLDQPILLLDEPTFGQDRANTRSLMERLVALNRAGRTIIMITHDLRLVAEYAQEVALLVEGTLIFRGRPEHLFARTDLLARGRLTVPPLIQVSRALAAVDPSFPLTATVEDLVRCLCERAGRPPAVSCETAGRLEAPAGSRNWPQGGS
ncbi:MAG: ABC transporter ATP-binding protein [Chloroflexi bacterium]|nr:ABC transporter ATP-binding protein [Chloroflexota bacterium]